MKANEEAEGEDRLTEEEILGQVASFVLAGSDTTGITLAQILQHFAEHPDAQKKLRKEIADARGSRNEDPSFEVLAQLPYLDAVVKETLRLCALLPIPR